MSVATLILLLGIASIALSSPVLNDVFGEVKADVAEPSSGHVLAQVGTQALTSVIAPANFVRKDTYAGTYTGDFATDYMAGSDIYFHFNPRCIAEKKIIMNTFRGSSWGSPEEKIDCSVLSFVNGQKFNFRIDVTASGFLVFNSLNVRVYEYKHRINTLNLMTGVKSLFTPTTCFEADLPGKYEYKFFPDALTSTAFVFKAKTSNDIHVLLSDSPSDIGTAKVQEIVLGGWTNTKSVIRSAKQGSNLVEKANAAICTASAFTTYWVSWTGGWIKAGTGNVPGLNVWMQWDSKASTAHLKYVALSSWSSAPASFSTCGVTQPNVPQPTCSCSDAQTTYKAALAKVNTEPNGSKFWCSEWIKCLAPCRAVSECLSDPGSAGWSE